MKVLFLKDVKGTARAGEVKEVSEGFARNYLIPQKLAVPATESALKQVKERGRVETSKKAREVEEAKALSRQIETLTLTFRAKVGDQQRLYGSITAIDIAEALEKATGHEIDRHRVELEQPIRRLGTHEVAVRLARDLVPRVKVVVVPEA